jgi:hypothetical protein
VYTLDLKTMLQIMQKHKQTGHLHTDLPSGVPGLRGPCHVDIVLEVGTMVSCTIKSARGALLTGDKAYQELTRLGRLRWTLVPSVPPAGRPGFAPQTLGRRMTPRPRRTMVVEQWQMQSWQRLHTLVYGLVDGIRGASEIADVLMVPSETIEGILRDLQAMQVIIME